MQVYSEVLEPHESIPNTMGAKEDVQRVHTRIDKVSDELRSSIAEVGNKKNRSTSISFLTLAVTVVGLPLGFLYFVEPHVRSDMKSDITIETQSQLKDPLKQLSDMSGDLREIKGKLEVLDPLIQEMMLKRLSEVKKFTSTDVDSHLAELKGLVQAAKATHTSLDVRDVQTVGEKVVNASKNSPDAWGVALDYLSYRTFINSRPSLPGEPVLQPQSGHSLFQAPKNVLNQGTAKLSFVGVTDSPNNAQFRAINEPDLNASKKTNVAFLILDDGDLLLDGVYMKNVIVENSHVIYRGGPVVLQNVTFVNCTFDVVRQAAGQDFAEKLLGPTTATNFHVG